MTLAEIEEYREAVRSLLRWSNVGISPMGDIAVSALPDDWKLVEARVQTYLAQGIPLADIKALADQREAEADEQCEEAEQQYLAWVAEKKKAL